MWSHFLRNSKISHFLEINFHNEIIYPRKVDKEAMCMLVVISLLALAGAYGVLYLTAYVPVSFFGSISLRDSISVRFCVDCKSRVSSSE